MVGDIARRRQRLQVLESNEYLCVTVDPDKPPRPFPMQHSSRVDAGAAV